MIISVILNTFNNSNTILRCLNSVINQTFKSFECVVVDDCSTDDTVKKVVQVIEKDSRFSLFKNNKNWGCSLSRKAGFHRSTGDYLLFIDGDDWLENDCLTRLFNKAKTESADIVFCDYYEEREEESKLMPQNIDLKNKNQIVAAMASYDPYLVSSLWNKLIRRDVIAKVDFPQERYGEDMYISLQLVYYSYKYAYVNYPLYHYWVDNIVSLSNNKRKDQMRRLAMYDICQKILRFLSTYYPTNEPFEPLLSIRVCKTALRIFEDSDLRSRRDALMLYPPAFRYLFRREVNVCLKTKIQFLLYLVKCKLISKKNNQINYGY